MSEPAQPGAGDGNVITYTATIEVPSETTHWVSVQPSANEEKKPGIAERLRAFARSVMERLRRRVGTEEEEAREEGKKAEAKPSPKPVPRAGPRPRARPRSRARPWRLPVGGVNWFGGGVSLPSLWVPVQAPAIAGRPRALPRYVSARPAMPNLGFGITPNPLLPSVIAPMRPNPAVLDLVGFQARPIGMPVVWAPQRRGRLAIWA